MIALLAILYYNKITPLSIIIFLNVLCQVWWYMVYTLCLTKTI